MPSNGQAHPLAGHEESQLISIWVNLLGAQSRVELRMAHLEELMKDTIESKCLPKVPQVFQQYLYSEKHGQVFRKSLADKTLSKPC